MARWKEVPIVDDTDHGSLKIVSSSVDLDELSFYAPLSESIRANTTFARFKGDGKGFIWIDMSYESFRKLMHERETVGAILS